MFVGRHGHSIAAAAHHDSQISRAFFDLAGHGVDKVWVIYRISRICPAVEHFNAFGLKQGNHAGFIRKASVIAA